jgi:hypothetical protein
MTIPKPPKARIHMGTSAPTVPNAAERGAMAFATSFDPKEMPDRRKILLPDI